MSFRTKVLASITATVVISVWIVAWLVSARITQSFERRDAERTASLLAQIRREFDRRGKHVTQRIEAISRSQSITRLAADAPANWPDYVAEAQSLAQEHLLDFLTIAGPDGAIISSAQWPARFGYKDEWLASNGTAAGELTLKREELPNGSALGLFARKTVQVGEKPIAIAGGEHLDQEFLDALPVSEGVRVTLIEGVAAPRDSRHAALLQRVRNTSAQAGAIVDGESVTAIPLAGLNDPIAAILLVTASRAELETLRQSIRNTGLSVGAAGVLVGVLLSVWASSRVTRPVRNIAATVREIAGGKWDARAPVASRDEIGRLAADINLMAGQLVEQKSLMIQSERVAAWRELARRLAHELKNPLFPLQITVENLQRAKESAPGEFDEVFRESTATLLDELRNLKTIIGRFSDFARMPAPHFEAVDVNEIARETLRLFEAQIDAPGRPQVDASLELDPSAPSIPADPEQLRRALRNLALNALDAMPQGGALTIRTRAINGKVAVEVADSGEGLTPEECERLFTPYYTTKQHGTGLGLAIVQSVVSDHHGSITVASEPGKGTTFRIELPNQRGES